MTTPSQEPQHHRIESLNINPDGDEIVEYDREIIAKRGKATKVCAALVAGVTVFATGVGMELESRKKSTNESFDANPQPTVFVTESPSPSASPTESASPSPTPSPTTMKPTPSLTPKPSPTVSVIVAKPSPSPSSTSAEPKPKPSPSKTPKACVWPSIGGNQYQVGKCGDHTAYDEPGEGPFQLSEGMAFEASCAVGGFIRISVANSEDYLKSPSYFNAGNLPAC